MRRATGIDKMAFAALTSIDAFIHAAHNTRIIRITFGVIVNSYTSFVAQASLSLATPLLISRAALYPQSSPAALNLYLHLHLKLYLCLQPYLYPQPSHAVLI